LRIQRQVKSLSSFTGSVRDIKSNGKNLACVSLDRNLKIYNTNKDKDKYSSKNNRLMSSIYLKNRLTKCLICDDISGESSDTGSDNNSAASSFSDNDNDDDSNNEEDEDHDKLIELDISTDEEDDDQEVERNMDSDSDENKYEKNKTKRARR